MDTTEAWLALRSKSAEELLAEFICPIKREHWLPPPPKSAAPAAAPVAPVSAAPCSAVEEKGAEEATTATSTADNDEKPTTSSSNGRKLAARQRLREARALKQCREWARSAECPWGEECIYAHGDRPGKVSRGGGGGQAKASAAAAAPREPSPPPPPLLPGRCPVDAAWPGSCEFAGHAGKEEEEGQQRCRWALHGGAGAAEEESEGGEAEEKVVLLCSLRQQRSSSSSSFGPSASTNSLKPETRAALFEGRYDYSTSISVLDSLGLSHGVTGKFASQARARAKRREARRKKEEGEEKNEGDDAASPAAAAAASALAAVSLAEKEGEERKDAVAAAAAATSVESDAGTLFYRETRLDARERRATSSSSLDLRDKLYLAPLTTVGNLPFRALAVSLGADVTCSEMALANNLLQGKSQEWALLKRHASEKVWGVQIAGGHADALARAAQLVSDCTDADFLDINMGCPIDLVAHKGAGAGLLARPKKIEALVKAVSGVLTHPKRQRDLPLTIKVRKGVKDGGDSVHSWLPLVAAGSWGSKDVVVAATIHGRSKVQRYSRDSDWGYVARCAKLCSEANPQFQTVSSGDVSSFAEYEALRESTGGAVAGVMLARGALVKPWLFTEIKERRDIDLPSTERLELYRQFASLGLGHWGSDARGVETTRRFFLEWMGFAHRYVPVGLLEEGALRRDAERAAEASACAAAAAAAAAAAEAAAATAANDDDETAVPAAKPTSWVSPSARRMLRLRSPRFKGRDDLETLLASTEPQDWVKVSEMLLGPAPRGFKFEPKHKSNAYSASAALDGDAERAAGGGAGEEEAVMKEK